MLKNFTLLMFFICTSSFLKAQIFEDFEGGTPDLPWAAINGATFGGAVDNPSKDAGNPSDFVGKLSNNDQSDFCFLLADLPTPVDLRVNNLLKMKVWSPISPTQILLKFEGGGKAVEKFVSVTTANTWVDYSFDFSAGADFTTLSKVLVAINPFTTPQAADFYFDDIRAVEARVVYETFETGNEMGWLGLDGVLEAPVSNPAPNKINGSANVGKYTKSETHAYSLLLADRGTNTFDLSVNNQFKLQVHASAPTQVLLKLEGAGPAVEKLVNIGLANAWQEYTFDFSAAKDFTHLTKAIIFFDPGVETSADVYHFDNLSAVPKGACAASTPDPNMIDDFECNRNATYVNGWDSLSVVANPAPGGANTSTTVGKYSDPAGEPYNALLIDYQNPIDLSTNNQLRFKLWSATPIPVLAKLEGGSSAAKEVWTNVTEVNTWVQYEVDFSDQALASHKKIVLFFNGGVESPTNDTYYIDDIEWGVKSTTDLENFENGALLPWAPLDGNTVVHGVFSVEDNPLPASPNTSAKVGKYSKGTSPYSTLEAVAPGIIDISSKPQYNVDVLAPFGATSIIMQLESVTGNKEVQRDLKNVGNWETVSFDFTEYQSTTDWVALRLLFNPGVDEDGAVYYFDNVRQSEATVDPCENTVAISNIIDDFECQRNYEYGAGSSLISAVANPKVDQNNSSTKVGLYKDQPNMPWDALCANIPDGIDLDAFNQLSFQVLSEEAVPVLLKLEGGSSPAKEIWSTITTPNTWETISVDFSGEKENDHRRVCLFFNGGVETTTEDKYYIDNLQFAHAPYDACIMNFDDPAFLSDQWKYFPSENSGGFELVDNPKVDAVNGSAKVGKAIEKASGEQPWQGMYTDLSSHIVFGANKIIKMKVLSPQIGTVTMKLERPLKEGAPQSGDLTVMNTKANEWEELSFDFGTTPVVEDGRYARITLIWDILNLPANDVIYYFDNIKIDGTSCGETTATGDEIKEQVSISPNPVSDILQLNNAEKISAIQISDILGRSLSSVYNSGKESTLFLNVSSFQTGTYFITTFDESKSANAVVKFVKL